MRVTEGDSSEERPRRKGSTEAVREEKRRRKATTTMAMMKWHHPLLGLMYVHASNAARYLITRMALTRGMSPCVYVFYRQAIATLTITPVAYFLQSDQISKLNLRNVGKISLLALLGITIDQNFNAAGLSLTSSTVAATMSNIIPALTLVMAVALGLEKLELWTGRGQAKVWGTLLCVGGAMTMTLFRGPAIALQHENSALILPVGVSAASEPEPGSSWILGALLLAGGILAWSTMVIYQAGQAGIACDCPSPLASTAVMCWMGTLQTAVVALLLEKPGAWRLNWDLQFLAIFYSAIFCSSIGLFVLMWCVKEKGPVFTMVFTPMTTVLVAIIEPLVLNVPLHWGSLMGMVMVIGGLYSVLWGKALDEELKAKERVEGAVSFEADSSTREPLLTQTKTDQTEI